MFFRFKQSGTFKNDQQREIKRERLRERFKRRERECSFVQIVMNACEERPKPETKRTNLCRVHTNCTRTDCEFRRIPWELSVQIEVQRTSCERQIRVSAKNDCENDAAFGRAGRGIVVAQNERREGDDDDAIGTERDLLETAISRERMKELKIAESFKEQEHVERKMEQGVVLDRRTGLIVRKVERVMVRQNVRASIRGRLVTQMKRTREKEAKEIDRMDAMEVLNNANNGVASGFVGKQSRQQQQQQQQQQQMMTTTQTTNDENGIHQQQQQQQLTNSGNDTTNFVIMKSGNDDASEDMSEDDCIDNDREERCCAKCDATRSTRWHETSVKKSRAGGGGASGVGTGSNRGQHQQSAMMMNQRKSSSRGGKKKSNQTRTKTKTKSVEELVEEEYEQEDVDVDDDDVETLLQCEECHMEMLKMQSEDTAIALRCVRCVEDKENKKGGKNTTSPPNKNGKKDHQMSMANYYNGTNGDVLCLKCYRIDYGKYVLNLRQEREEVKEKEKVKATNNSKLLANRNGVRLENAPKWAGTSILPTTYGIAVLPPPKGAKEYPKDWCACCERFKDLESKSSWGMSKTVYGAALCHNCYRSELEGFKKHGCEVCDKSWVTNLYFRSKMNIAKFICKDCFVDEKKKMFPEEEKRIVPLVTQAANNRKTMTTSGAPKAQRTHFKGGPRFCCICASDRSSLAGWYNMRDRKEQKVEGRFTCNRCYTNFLRPGRPMQRTLSQEQFKKVLTTSTGVIRYCDLNVGNSGEPAFTFNSEAKTVQDSFKTPHNAPPRSNILVLQNFKSDGFDEIAYNGNNDNILRNSEADNITCDTCNKGDNPQKLILCDGCDAGHHTFCIGLSRVPLGQWFCKKCAIITTKSPKKTFVVKKSTYLAPKQTSKEQQPTLFVAPKPHVFAPKPIKFCGEENPCDSCGCIDADVENITPIPLKSIKCFCRVCCDKYQSNIRHEDGSKLSLDLLLDRVFKSLPKHKTKSEEAKNIDKTIVNKVKWGSETEWNLRQEANAGLTTQIKILNTSWLPPPTSKTRVRQPVVRFSSEGTFAKHGMGSLQPFTAFKFTQSMNNSTLAPEQRNPSGAKKRRRYVSPSVTHAQNTKERNRQAAARSRARVLELKRLRSMAKNLHKTEEELMAMLPKGLRLQILRPIMIAPEYSGGVTVVKRKPEKKVVVLANIPTLSPSARKEKGVSREQRVREALQRLKERAKFIEALQEMPTHKNKIKEDLFHLLPEHIQFRKPPNNYEGNFFAAQKQPATAAVEKEIKSVVKIQGKKITTIAPKKTQKRKRERVEEANLNRRQRNYHMDVAHADGRLCVTCGSNTTPHGDWYRTEKGNDQCKTYFCSRCAKIPANRIARGGGLRERSKRRRV